MADIDEDDEFGSDGAFDDLPPNTLLQLEQQASQFAQPGPRPVSAHNANTRQAVNQKAWQSQNQGSFQSDRTVQPNNRREEYGYDDEDIIDLDQDPYAIQQPYNQGPTLAGRLQHEAQAAHTANNHAALPAPQGSARDDASITDLQARILQV
jgi:hypothetical protein